MTPTRKNEFYDGRQKTKRRIENVIKPLRRREKEQYTRNFKTFKYVIGGLANLQQFKRPHIS